MYVYIYIYICIYKTKKLSEDEPLRYSTLLSRFIIQYYLLQTWFQLIITRKTLQCICSNAKRFKYYIVFSGILKSFK